MYYSSLYLWKYVGIPCFRPQHMSNSLQHLLSSLSCAHFLCLLSSPWYSYIVVYKLCKHAVENTYFSLRVSSVLTVPYCHAILMIEVALKLSSQFLSLLYTLAVIFIFVANLGYQFNVTFIIKNHYIYRYISSSFFIRSKV